MRKRDREREKSRGRERGNHRNTKNREWVSTLSTSAHAKAETLEAHWKIDFETKTKTSKNLNSP